MGLMSERPAQTGKKGLQKVATEAGQGSWLSSTRGLARCSEKYDDFHQQGLGTGTVEMGEALVVQQKRICQGEFSVWLKELKPGLCDNLEGGMGCEV